MAAGIAVSARVSTACLSRWADTYKTVDLYRTARNELVGGRVAVAVQRNRAFANVRQTTTLADAGLGGAIGYLSGLVGIGGGIFLSPIQHFMRWAPPRQIAATASVFILVNSVAGLAGQLTKLGTAGLTNLFPYWPLLLVVLLGGQIGSHAGIRLFSEPAVRRATGILIIAISIQLMWKTFSG